MNEETKKSVKFNHFGRVRHTLHRKDYTDDELESTWYTRRELAVIKREVRETILGNAFHTQSEQQQQQQPKLISIISSTLDSKYFLTRTANTASIHTVNKETKKSVKFNPLVRVRHSLHRNDYTDDELESTWYTRRELAVAQHEVRETIVKMVQQGQLLGNNDQYCPRGLESSTPHGISKKTLRRRRAELAVVREQNLQEKRGLDDPELIALAYKVTTEDSQRIAYEMGKKDYFASCQEHMEKKFKINRREISRFSLSLDIAQSYQLTGPAA
jgi:hypothetical protein